MAEKLISPGVFMTENSLDYIAPGIAAIGAAVIGPTTKGPAFIPTEVTSINDYYVKFGASDGNSYVPYTVKEYMKNATSTTIVRILGLGGYTHDSVAHIIASGSYGQKVVGTIHRSTEITSADPTDDLGASTVTGSATSFQLHIEGTNTAETTDYSASFDSTDANFVQKILPTGANTADAGYAYVLFSNSISDLLTTDASSSVSMDFTNLALATDYSEAATPYITSQTVGGKVTNLFRFKTFSHGVNANTEIKIAIDNVKFASEVPNSDYGTFSVIIRDITDTDRNQIVLEQFNNVNLNPNSTQYIGRVIGDKYPTYVNGDIISTGDYNNLSKYVAVEVVSGIKNETLPTTLVPWGFKSVYQPIVTPTDTYLPNVEYVTDQTYNSEYNSTIYYGFNFDFTNTDNKQYLKPVQTGATVGLNSDFTLDDYTVNTDSSIDPGVAIIDASVITARKFIVPFQGGFDGQDPATKKNLGADITAANTMGYNLTSATTSGSVAYIRAFNLLSNADQYDFNMLITPGVVYQYHSSVCERGISLCENRGDAFYIMDSNILGASVTTAANTVLTLDTNYAATYFPWVKLLDSDLNKYLWVPTSTVIAGAISYNDRVGYEWFAPAGFNRGALTSVVDVYQKLNKADRDTLYEARVNPIIATAKEGIAVWGQKTLQARSSALDRVNVRRLLINVKKFIASVGKYILFEPNTRVTRNQFLNQVNPYMEQIQQKQGLYQFNVVMDESNNTADVIDRNILKGALYLQPTKTAEFLSIDLNVQSSGTIVGE